MCFISFVRRREIGMTEKNWISIAQRLPKHESLVLVFSAKGQCVCFFIDTCEMNKQLVSKGYPQEQWNAEVKPFSFCSQEVRGNILNGVTHWMPLPEAPI
jgi:hypothetical protein